jgi:hypothetical protein
MKDQCANKADRKVMCGKSQIRKWEHKVRSKVKSLKQLNIKSLKEISKPKKPKSTSSQATTMSIC